MEKHQGDMLTNTRRVCFETTSWSNIFLVRTSDIERKNLIINSLLEKYWKPIYGFIRQKGYGHDQAKDLTQDFITEIVLGRELIQRAEKAKGRFRTFLLFALKCYLSDIYRKQRTKRRHVGHHQIDLEHLEAMDLPQSIYSSSPDDLFHYFWAVEFLEKVIKQAEIYCIQSGKLTHWNVFRDKILIPIQKCSQPPSLKVLCERYNIVSEAQASNMIVTMKRSFRRILHEQVKNCISEDSDVQEELQDILSILGKLSVR